MASLQELVENYIQTMVPMGLKFYDELQSWNVSGAKQSKILSLIETIHQFAGSAGSAGFMRLSSIATLIEVGCQGIRYNADVADLDRDQILALGEDFKIEIESLMPERSSLVTGIDIPMFEPFSEPPQIIIAGMPEGTTRILSFVIEQKMGIPLPAPSLDILNNLSKDRAPNLVIVPCPVAEYDFPVVVYAPACFDDITASWPVI